jgi:xylulose-5-phosphate/fructose-6-phosphate phosphoketolase
MPTSRFVELFTVDKPVIFAFHGYQRAIHQIIHGQPNTDRFHVRGFNEQGTTTTPFDMVVLNEMSRYHLIMEALRRANRFPERIPALMDECRAMLDKHHDYVRTHFEDMPEVRDWVWTD